MPIRFVHRLLQSRRALPSIRRSSSPANLPPETSMVSTAFRKELSSSTTDGEQKDAGRRSRDEYVQSLVNSPFPHLVEYWKKRIMLEKEVAIRNVDLIQKVKEYLDEHSRSIQLSKDLMDEILGRDDQYIKDHIEQIRQLLAMMKELYSVLDDVRYEDCKTEDDREKWVDGRVEKLKKVNESISEINVFAKRLIASSSSSSEEEEKKEKSRGWIWLVMFLLLVLPLEVQLTAVTDLG